MKAKAKRILVLYIHNGSLDTMLVAILSHLRALEASDTAHEIFYYNAIDGAPAWLKRFRFDIVVLHTTLLCMRWSPIFNWWKRKLRWIKDLDCVTIAMPQDEYDHAEILDEWLAEWNVPIVFSNFGAVQRKLLYPILHDKATFYRCLTGYIDQRLAKDYEDKLLPLQARPNDIVYRAKHLPYRFGSHGQFKHKIGEDVLERAIQHGLKCDISTRREDTIFGSRWLDFLASGKVVIGTESGSSSIDRRGEITGQIQQMLRDDPTLSFEAVSARLPYGWDNYRFFAISPRHFEAVITKTAQVLVEGKYNGVLEPHTHYIPLKADFSNLDDVLDMVHDHEMLQRMVDRAYKDICLNGEYTYRRLAADIEQALATRPDSGKAIMLLSPFDRLLWKWGQVLQYLAIRKMVSMVCLYRFTKRLLGAFRIPHYSTNKTQ